MPTYCYACKKHASYRTDTTPRVYSCAGHKQEGMVLVKKENGKMCETCHKVRASYGMPGDKPHFCDAHSLPGMIHIGNASMECDEIVDGVKCQTGSSYGYPNKRATKCALHALSNMIRRTGKKCVVCGKLDPQYYNKGEPKTAKYCFTCKTPGMLNISRKLCESCNLCEIKYHKKLCQYCDPETRVWKKTKESALLASLEADEELPPFIHDKSTGFGCGNYRPDFLFETDKHCVIVECDEDQHKAYEETCEVTRMYNIAQSLFRPCVFLRFNPDQYISRRAKRNPSHEERYATLRREVLRALESPPSGTVQIIHLYYDGDATVVDVTRHAEEMLKSL